MSYEVPGFKLGTLTAAVSLAAAQYKFAKAGGTAGQADFCLAADTPIGIIQNKPAAGESVELMCHGVSKVLAGAAFAAGSVVGADATSRAVSNPTTPSGIALEAAAAAGELVAVLIQAAALPVAVASTKLAASTTALPLASAGVIDLLAAAAATRQVVITATVTQVFANGDGTQPTFSIGEESGSASKFAATTKFTSAAAGATFVFGGTLTSGKKLQATAVAGTGTTETGALSVTVVAVG